MSSVARITALALLSMTGLAGLAGCSDVEVKNPPWTSYDPKDQRIRDQYGTFSGKDGYTIFSTGKTLEKGDTSGGGGGGGGGGIGVNAFLWRGTLETIDFMPLASADPFGGLIITDWYTPPQSPNERLKLQILIKDQVLRADGVKVSVFRQTREAGGNWVDATVDPKTATELEDKILTRARELRVASLSTES